MGGHRGRRGRTGVEWGVADLGRGVPGGAERVGAVTEGGVGAQLAVIALVALAGAPAVVATALHQVHLLELVLAHVAAEEAPAAGARRRVAAVEGAAPHVAYPEGVDLRPRGGVAHKRVVRRDAVERAALVAVHVDAQHLAQQRRSAGESTDWGGAGGRGLEPKASPGARQALAMGPETPSSGPQLPCTGWVTPIIHLTLSDT